MQHQKLLRLLFVCVENSNRSQMAEAFARMHAEEFARKDDAVQKPDAVQKHGDVRIEAYSAGSRPSGKINPKAIASMRERDYDLSTHLSKSLDDLPEVAFDAAVTMGCGDACPNVRAGVREDWNIPDPRNMSPDEFRNVRDEIEAKVLELLSRLRTRGSRDVSQP